MFDPLHNTLLSVFIETRERPERVITMLAQRKKKTGPAKGPARINTAIELRGLFHRCRLTRARLDLEAGMAWAIILGRRMQ